MSKKGGINKKDFFERPIVDLEKDNWIRDDVSTGVKALLEDVWIPILDKKKLQVFTELLSGWTPIILGPSWWIGWALFQLLQDKSIDVVWLWTRQVGTRIENKLSEWNSKGLYFLWDLFSDNRTNNEAIEALLSSVTANASWLHLYNAATNMDSMAELDEKGNVIDEIWNIISPDDENYKDQLDAINPKTMKRWDIWTLPELKNAIRKAEADKQVKLFHDYLDNILQNRNTINMKTLTIVYLWSIANMFWIAGSAYGDFKKECSELAEEYRIKFALKFGNWIIKIIDLSLALTDTTMWNQRTHLLETTWKIVQFKWRWLPVWWEKINQEEMFQPDALAQFFFDIMQEDSLYISSRMLIHSPESIDIEKQKKQYMQDMTYILDQYAVEELDKDDWKVILNEKAKEFLLNLMQYKLDEYYNNYYNLYPFELIKEEQSIFEKYWLISGESVDRNSDISDYEWEIISIYNNRLKRLGKPNKSLLAKNIRKWERIFSDLSLKYTALPKDIFLSQAMRFLNNHI